MNKRGTYFKRFWYSLYAVLLYTVSVTANQDANTIMTRSSWPLGNLLLTVRNSVKHEELPSDLQELYTLFDNNEMEIPVGLVYKGIGQAVSLIEKNRIGFSSELYDSVVEQLTEFKNELHSFNEEDEADAITNDQLDVEQDAALQTVTRGKKNCGKKKVCFVQCRGPQGPQGKTGATGPTGASFTGPTGPTGANGCCICPSPCCPGVCTTNGCCPVSCNTCPGGSCPLTSNGSCANGSCANSGSCPLTSNGGSCSNGSCSNGSCPLNGRANGSCSNGSCNSGASALRPSTVCNSGSCSRPNSCNNSCDCNICPQNGCSKSCNSCCNNKSKSICGTFLFEIKDGKTFVRAQQGNCFCVVPLAQGRALFSVKFVEPFCNNIAAVANCSTANLCSSDATTCACAAQVGNFSKLGFVVSCPMPATETSLLGTISFIACPT